jgi:hypothetical protein
VPKCGPPASDYNFTPYASAKIFYDSRYSTVAGYRLAATATLPVYCAFSVQLYFIYEVNFVGSSTIQRCLRPDRDCLVLTMSASAQTR